MRKAFTLVELLIVVTIISVLTGAAVPFVNEYLEEARSAKVKNDLDVLAGAINTWEVLNAKDYSDTTGAALVGRFVTKIPIDPWGTQISFASATEAKGSYISSAGSDHEFGTPDDFRQDYKGKLAIVSAKWFDTNGDGKISIQSSSYPGTDTFTVRFNRQPDTTSSAKTILANSPFVFITKNWLVTTAGWDNFFATSVADTAVVNTTSGDKRGWVYVLQTDPVSPEFALGSDTIQFRSTLSVTDKAMKPNVGPTPVTITAK